MVMAGGQREETHSQLALEYERRDCRASTLSGSRYMPIRGIRSVYRTGGIGPHFRLFPVCPSKGVTYAFLGSLYRLHRSCYYLRQVLRLTHPTYQGHFRVAFLFARVSPVARHGGTVFLVSHGAAFFITKLTLSKTISNSSNKRPVRNGTQEHQRTEKRTPRNE